MKRIMGLETEYGILGQADKVLDNYRGKGNRHENRAETNRSAITGFVDRGHIGGDYDQELDSDIASGIGFTASGYSTPFRHWRGYSAGYSRYFGRDEMLSNGARFYIDMGHPEYSTPECTNPRDAVIADKAGERVLEKASDSGKIARIFKNNTDGINSYGCHENYLIERVRVNRFQDLAEFMTPFFVSRIVYTGAGKIGFRFDRDDFRMQRIATEIMENYNKLQAVSSGKFEELYRRVKKGLKQLIDGLREGEVIYQLSQRADFFKQLIGLQTTYDRPIINTRDEPLADKEKYMRFHVINGDANMSEIATYLKLGTCSLVLDLFERGFDGFKIEDAVSAFHAISKDPSLKAKVKTSLGELSALEMQSLYLERAESELRGRDSMTNELLDRWRATLNILETNPMQLDRQLDWVIKKRLIDSYMQRKGVSMTDASVRDIDLRYHELGNGFFYMLQKRGLVDRLVSDEEIEHAIDNPPEDTRAFIRAMAIEKGWGVNWSFVTNKKVCNECERHCTKGKTINLDNPLHNYSELQGELLKSNL